MLIQFDRQIDELRAFSGRGTRVLSLYLRTHPAAVDTAALMEQLHAVVRGLHGRLDEVQRSQLDEDLEAVRDYLGSMVAPPPAVAIFTCAPRRFFRVVRLPLDIQPAVYWSEAAEVEPLSALAERAQEVFDGAGRHHVML